MRILLPFFVALGLAAGIAGSAPGQTPMQIGRFTDWSAHMIKGSKGKVCYVHGEPKSQAGKYTKRDRTFLQVAHRPAEKVRGEISLTAGYSYKKGSEVDAEVDGKRYMLFTQRDGAWTRDAKADRQLVAALKAGRKLIVRGTSSRGTKTTDVYSLSGFSAAYNAIGKACGMR